MADLFVTYINFHRAEPNSEEVRQDFTDVINYINDRNDGSSSWDVVKTDVLIITPRASDPASPSNGEIWYNSTDEQFYGQTASGAVILG